VLRIAMAWVSAQQAGHLFVEGGHALASEGRLCGD
jgi:hypothetical protein